MTNQCQICGRTKEELVEEFNRDFEITKEDDESVYRCDKCRKEYQRENGGVEDEENEVDSNREVARKDWKDKAVA